jgi:hypothetical protein
MEIMLENKLRLVERLGYIRIRSVTAAEPARKEASQQSHRAGKHRDMGTRRIR